VFVITVIIIMMMLATLLGTHMIAMRKEMSLVFAVFFG
jgi:hypothetical protein